MAASQAAIIVANESGSDADADPEGPTLIPESDPDTDALSCVDALVIEFLSSDTTSARLIEILHEMATFLENLEIEYGEKSGNRHGTFDEDMRDDFRIGLVLDALNNHESFLDVVLGRIVGTERNTTPEQAQLQTASYRLLMACSVGPNATAVAFAAEESVVDFLIDLIFNSSVPPVRSYATGFLSVALLERRVADRVVRQGLPSRLLQNLVRSHVVEHGHFPFDFDHPEAPLSKSLPDNLFTKFGETVRTVATKDLMRLECAWTLQCLASMGDYQETLGPATNSGVINIILGILESPHEALHLDAIELAWHMLAHKRFASAFVREGGVQLLLRLSDQSPEENPIHGCITLCFSGLASLSSVMEQTCQLGEEVTEKMVDHAIRLTTSVRELHRRNAGLFLSVALPFPTLLRHFDVGNYGLAALIRLLDSPLRGLASSSARPRSRSFSRGRRTSSSGTGNRSVITADPSISSIPASSATASSTTTTTTNEVIDVPVDSAIAGQERGAYRPFRGSTMPERHIGHSCALAIRQVFRSHLALVTNIMRRRIVNRQRHQKEENGPDNSVRRPARPRLNSWSAGSTAKVLPHRALEIDDVSTAKNIALIETYWQVAIPILQDAGWKPVNALVQHRGLHALLNVVAATNRFGARNNYLLESSRYALDVLGIAAFLPRVCKLISEIEVTTDGRGATGMTVLLVAAAGSAHHDPLIIILSLQVLCHMVTPRHFNLNAVDSTEGPTKRTGSFRRADREQENIQKKLRVSARNNDGIAVCLSLLEYKGSPNSADAIRHFAARFLLGLAQDQSVAQILEKLKVPALLKRLWRDGPIVQVNKRHHQQFRNVCTILLRRLAGTHQLLRSSLQRRLVKHTDSEATKNAVARLSQASRTDMQNFHKEMHKLVYEYLRSQGLNRSAVILAKEASITGLNMPSHHSQETKSLQVPKHLTNWPAKKIAYTLKRSRWRRPRPPSLLSRTRTSIHDGMHNNHLSPRRGYSSSLVQKHSTDTGSRKRARNQSSSSGKFSRQGSQKRRKTSQAIPDSLIDFDTRFNASLSSPASKPSRTSSAPSAAGSTSSKPLIKFFLKRSSSSKSSPRAKSVNSPNQSVNKQRTFLKTSQEISGASLEGKPSALVGIVQSSLSINSTRSLTRQDSHPGQVSQELDRSARDTMAGYAAYEDQKNHALNLRRRQVFGQSKCRSHHSSAHTFGVFSHFRQMRTYRSDIGDVMYSSVSFLGALNSEPRHLLVTGQENGIVGIRNLWSCDTVITLEAHNSQVESLDSTPCHDQRLLLTGSSDGCTKIWDTSRLINQHTLCEHASYEDSFNPKFSHSGSLMASSQIIHDPDSLGSIQIGQRYRTTVFDLETKAAINVLEDQTSAIMYRSGCCCFDSLDQLVFCDGQAWDIRSNSVAMRFDRLGNDGLAVFHPRRSELIIDSAIWDLRKPSRLLKVVDALQESKANYSVLGDAVYTYKLNPHDAANRPAAQVVRVLDSWGYRDIGQPIELESHYARDLCVDRTDDYIAIAIDTHNPSESCVKLYEVGRRKPNEADSDMDDAQTDSEEEDEDGNEFGFEDGDQYYNPDDTIILDDESDFNNWLFA